MLLKKSYKYHFPKVQKYKYKVFIIQLLFNITVMLILLLYYMSNSDLLFYIYTLILTEWRKVLLQYILYMWSDITYSTVIVYVCARMCMEQRIENSPWGIKGNENWKIYKCKSLSIKFYCNTTCKMLYSAIRKVLNFTDQFSLAQTSPISV